MTQENVNKVKEVLARLNETSCTRIDLPYYMNEDVNSFDELRDSIEDNNGFDIEIIYYSNAIEYLQENDPSLRESLEIASEYGFETGKLNSEILASLLASRNERDEFYELESELTELFEEITELESSIED
jgi:hypothetical protein